MKNIDTYGQLEAATKQPAVHKVLKQILRIRHAVLPAATLLDSPAESQTPPLHSTSCDPCAAPATAGESTLSATGVDVRRMAKSFAFVDASVLIIMIGYAIGKHL